MSTRRGVADLNGTRLHYEMVGAGQPLVLIHGSGLDLRMWDDQAIVFSRHHLVVRYDRRGFGRSAIPSGGAYAHYEDLKALLDHLDVGRPCLLGHSSGGRAALDFAVRYPDAVRGLILYGSVVGGYRFEPDFAASLEAVRSTARAYGVEAAKAPWLALLDCQPLEALGGPSALARIVSEYSGWHWLHADPERLADTPTVERLGCIRAPTLILLGERDVPDVHRIADRVQAEVPRARRVVLPRAGHMANLEVPERFNRAVLDFLALL